MKRLVVILAMTFGGCQAASDYVTHKGIPEWTHHVPVVKQAVESNF